MDSPRGGTKLPAPVKLSSLFIAAVISPAIVSAHPVKWTSTGKVTSVTAAAYPGVAVNDPVEVEFSYDSSPYTNGLSELMIEEGVYFFKAEFADSIDLKMSVTIGSQTWQGALPVSERGGNYALYSESWDGGGSPDIFRVTLTSSDNASFPSFPYSGATASRRMELTLNDAVTPCDFLDGQSLPRKGTDVSQITEASGAILAGIDRIRFSLDLPSIKVIEEEPKIPLSFDRTLTGFELKWFGEPGAIYQLLKSEDLEEWEEMSIHEGLDEDITVPVGPFLTLPERCFYKVIKL